MNGSSPGRHHLAICSRAASSRRHAPDFQRARARLSAQRAAGGTPVPTSPVAHPLGARSAAVLKRAEVAEDGVGCGFRLVGSLRRVAAALSAASARLCGALRSTPEALPGSRKRVFFLQWVKTDPTVKQVFI